ncbi:MAG TPA: exosortase [Steroidobacteraceae bacterium]
MSPAAAIPGRLARPVFAILLVLGTFLALWPTTQSLALRWTDTVNRAYTHGALVVVLCCFLLWHQRDALARVVLRPSWVACLSGLALGIAWLILLRAGVQIGHQALLPLIAFCAVWAAFGSPAMRVLWLPVLYAYFTVPVWDLLNPLLQWLSTFAVRGFLSLIGLPVYFDGLHFQIPAGIFEIAGGCSGLHFFIVGVAIAVFYGELHRDRLGTRMKLVALAIGMAMLTNWVRIAIIIVAGHLTDMQHYLVSGEHYTFGWAMFAVSMAIYFLIVRRWTAESVAAAPPSLPGASLAPLGVVLACVTLAMPGLWQWLDTNQASPASAAAEKLPATVVGWRELPPRNEPGPAEFVNADGFEARTFNGDGEPVDAYRAFYFSQEQGRELAGYANRPQGPDMQVRSNVVTPDGLWREIKAQYSADDDWLVWFAYRVDGHRDVDALRAQLRYGVNSLRGNPLSSAWVLRTRCVADCPMARARLARFARDSGMDVSGKEVR